MRAHPAAVRHEQRKRAEKKRNGARTRLVAQLVVRRCVVWCGVRVPEAFLGSDARVLRPVPLVGAGSR